MAIEVGGKPLREWKNRRPEGLSRGKSNRVLRTDQVLEVCEVASSSAPGEGDRVLSVFKEICLKPSELWCYKKLHPRNLLAPVRFCGEELCNDQPTAARLAGTLPQSGDGTRPEEADGDCSRTN